MLEGEETVLLPLCGFSKQRVLGLWETETYAFTGLRWIIPVPSLCTFPGMPKALLHSRLPGTVGLRQFAGCLLKVSRMGVLLEHDGDRAISPGSAGYLLACGHGLEVLQTAAIPSLPNLEGFPGLLLVALLNRNAKPHNHRRVLL